MYKDWRHVQGSHCNPETNERGLGLLEFASCNTLNLANTLGHHKNSRKWTYHALNSGHNQIDYILVQQCFRSEKNIRLIKIFPWAAVGSNHELAMISFRLHL